MIIILTQCFPSRVGGIETLMYNLALHLSSSKDVIVLADQQNFKEDNIFDQNEINFSTKRFRGIKFLRNRKKFNELKKIHVSSKIDAVISDSWKSLEVPIDFLKKNKIPVISLAHGNEIIIKNDKHHKRVKKILEHVNAIVVNSSYTKNLLNKLSKLPSLHPISITFKPLKSPMKLSTESTSSFIPFNTSRVNLAR